MDELKFYPKSTRTLDCLRIMRACINKICIDDFKVGDKIAIYHNDR